MDRRSFLAALGTRASLQATVPAVPRIGAATMQSRLEGLSAFGRPQGGTFQDGVSRVGYSDADVSGRRWVMDLMRMAGAEVRIDAAGNIFATRPGQDRSLPPLLFGSHIDSVPNGGNFDGTLGSLSAVEILRVLNENRVVTKRPLTAVVWACEEASFEGLSLNGSRVAAGQMRPEELNVVSRGQTKAEAIRKIGGDPGRLETARIQPGRYHAYVELHIEQGGVLAREGLPAGVVDGIVAIDDFEVTITGAANHAGTTPMKDRQDAMVAAAALTLAVKEVATAEPGAQVGTVGHLEVIPNAVNVVPGEVRMSVEFRDLSAAKLDALGGRIEERAARIAGETRTRIGLKRISRHEAALAAPEIQRVIEAGANRLGLRFRHLPSGAGHDAQMMARLMPMGMIFVPSIGGISHSPKELTPWEDCANGANLLLEAVLALAA